MTPELVAEKLEVAVSSVYNLRNGYFAPGLDLALRIEEISKGAVPAKSWKPGKRRAKAK